MHDPNRIITETLVENGHRLTAARCAIIETLITSGGHISADELANRVRQDAPQIGRMTVYRTLDLLCELGLIRPIYQGTGAAHYILLHAGSHHHLVCNQCNKVIEFDECTTHELGQQLSRQFNFQITSHLLEFHGLCADCMPFKT